MTQQAEVRSQDSEVRNPESEILPNRVTPHCDWCASGAGSCGKCPPMTNADRMALIIEIHGIAVQQRRELTVAEMDAIDRLRDQIHKEQLAWMNERSPIPAGATNALEA